MNNLQIFESAEFGSIRTITINGERWFVGKDVAEALGYKNTKDALASHVKDCDKIRGSRNTTLPIKDSRGIERYPTWINESGLYSFIFSSKQPTAEKFKNWIIREGLLNNKKREALQTNKKADDYLIENVQIFRNNDFGTVRTLMIDGEPWFVGKDVAEILGYRNTRKALADHVDVEDKMNGVTIRDSIGREQNPVCINESGLYALIFGSKLESAKRFKHWVTSEVLPTLRKTGIYAMDGRKIPTTYEDAIIELADQIKEKKKIQQENKLLLEDNERMKPKEVFTDAVTSSEDCIYMRDLAKLLKQNGIETGEKRLYKWMRENGYIIKSKYKKNLPSQYSMELGLFQIKESPFTAQNGNFGVGITTMVTGKGQAYFITKFLERKNQEA